MRLDHLLSKEFVLKSAPFCWLSCGRWRGGACFWVDACRPHGAVFDTKCLTGMSVRCRVSGKTPSTTSCARLVGRVCGVGGLFFLWALVACWPRLVWLVGFLVVLCENWIVDASILIFL